MIEFLENDLKQMEEMGVTQQKVLKQIETFMEGIPYTRLERAAVVGDGILRFTNEESAQLVKAFEKAAESLETLKFVPASGAASRMFKALFHFLQAFNPGKETLEEYLERTADNDIRVFTENLERFPFYQNILDITDEQFAESGRALLHFIHRMLDASGLNYDFYPKGLLPFHQYESHVATAFEEHLREAADYASAGGNGKLHFTISPQHEDLFKDTYAEIKDRIEKETGTHFDVGYSFQKPATDTIAVTPENEPFRQADGTLLFRPGGHGALIENLNEQEADIIFIKNIDNVAVPSVARESGASKKLLAGVLLNIQEKAFRYAAMLEGPALSGEQVQEIRDFLIKELNVRFSDNYSSFSLGEQLDILRDKINRPIRVCGMVRNEGEPGGGPYWVRDPRNHVSLQIVESAQADLADDEQKHIFHEATHFNPVDLVCGVRNHRGEKYNLLNFVDTDQGFIAEKTKDGKPLKALELPGLWNGAMAYWNTVFVEVPLLTFNPVKTVNDLLKPAHQGSSN
ncbi:DUF4301 family protein [Lentiprolixibacter aurantiacus]|uniref:DUF4301 family protein n=1 Tax=Lentiprolixibacter aurantiacus TaxID=2993939 RepID=A0AAE3SMG4_9FLAO|nr:DUF4301 family protein [Lentiprolixibacter aurantiacus]MCX2718261.1 DUF4301 family protein [Lentiprolixibacter aurantiacus]